MTEKLIDQLTADEWNEHYEVGTPVRYWPGAREGEGIRSVTRTPAWTLGSGDPVVSVKGYPGGIHLSHVAPDATQHDKLTERIGIAIHHSHSER